MEIKITSDAEFQILLTALAGEIVDTNIHWRLLQNLGEKLEVFSREFNQSSTFWSFTFRAHLNSTIFGLMRIFDGNSKSLSLTNLLDTIVANLQIFDVDQFRKRLKKNPFVNSLAEEARKPDEQQLKLDVAFSSNDHEIVKKLTIWRSNLFAHRNAENVLSGKNIASDFPLNDEEIGVLVDGGVEILNRYSSLFRATTYSPKIIGHDDYEFVLESLTHKLESIDRDLEEEAARIIGE